MNREELIKSFRDDKFMKKLAATFVRFKDLNLVASKFATTGELIEDIFIDHPDLEDRFNQAVYDYSRTLAMRKIRAGLDEALGKLNELITDPDEDPQVAYKAANALLSVWAKTDINKPGGGKETRDDLDDIWEMIQDEAETEKDSKDSEGTK
jgi:hypothetical protein